MNDSSTDGDSFVLSPFADDEPDMEVKSELYGEKAFEKIKSLENSYSLVTLNFLYLDSSSSVVKDEDGDLVVPRKTLKTVEIEFSQLTVIPLVGLQIWRGALLLGDFILSQHRDIFENRVVLEVATGVGFTSIVAAMVAKTVTSTDIDKGGILNLIKRNIERNNHLIKASTSVLPLDFYQQDWDVVLEKRLKETEIVIAADVVYDNELSEAFVKCLTKLLMIPPKKTFFLALEKRYVFTVDDLDVVAPCYEHFFKYLRTYWSTFPMNTWKIEQVVVDFDQIFNYERTKHLVLWKFTT